MQKTNYILGNKLQFDKKQNYITSLRGYLETDALGNCVNYLTTSPLLSENTEITKLKKFDFISREIFRMFNYLEPKTINSKQHVMNTSFLITVPQGISGSETKDFNTRSLKLKKIDGRPESVLIVQKNIIYFYNQESEKSYIINSGNEKIDAEDILSLDQSENNYDILILRPHAIILHSPKTKSSLLIHALEGDEFTYAKLIDNGAKTYFFATDSSGKLLVLLKGDKRPLYCNKIFNEEHIQDILLFVEKKKIYVSLISTKGKTDTRFIEEDLTLKAADSTYAKPHIDLFFDKNYNKPKLRFLGRNHLVVNEDHVISTKLMPPPQSIHSFQASVLNELGVFTCIPSIGISLVTDPRNSNIWFYESNMHRELAGHTDLISFLDYNRQTKEILSASIDKTVRIWNKNGENSETLLHDEAVINAIFTAKGIMTVTTSGKVYNYPRKTINEL